MAPGTWGFGTFVDMDGQLRQFTFTSTKSGVITYTLAKKERVRKPVSVPVPVPVTEDDLERALKKVVLPATVVGAAILVKLAAEAAAAAAKAAAAAEMAATTIFTPLVPIMPIPPGVVPESQDPEDRYGDPA